MTMKQYFVTVSHICDWSICVHMFTGGHFVGFLKNFFDEFPSEPGLENSNC